MSEKFRTPYGLPTRFESESGQHIENEFLFGCYEYMFNIRRPMYSKSPVAKYFDVAASLGFPNHIEPDVPEKKLSHDQVTAYMCFSTLFHYELEDEIYHAAKEAGTISHPRDFIYYNLLRKVWYAFLLLPVVYLLAAISMFIPYRVTKDEIDRPDQVFRFGKYIIRKKLSGELLYVLKVYAVKDDMFLKISMYPVKLIVELGAKLRYGSVENMVKAYFMGREDHPIVAKYSLDF